MPGRIIDSAADLAEGVTVYGEVRGRRLPATIAPMPFQPTTYKR